MHIRTRKIIFYALIVLFLVVGTFLVLRAQGIVVNFSSWEVKKAGGLFLRFLPNDATITINGKREDTTNGLLARGTLINNLPAGLYEVVLQKDGFAPWKKYVPVQSGIVTSISHILLWPKNPVFQTVATSTRRFWTTSAGIITERKDGSLVFKGGHIRGTTLAFHDAHSPYIITATQQARFLVDLRDATAAINIDALFSSLKQRQLGLPGIVPLKNFFRHPFSADTLLLQTETSLYALDIRKIRLEKLATVSRIGALALTANEAFLVDEQNSALTVLNLIFKTSSQYPFSIKSKITSMQATGDGTSALFLTADGELLLFERASSKIRPVASSVLSFTLPSEGRRVLFSTADNRVFIFYLTDFFDENERWQKGALLPIGFFPAVAPLSELSWIPASPTSFFMQSGGSILAGEADKYEPHDAVSIAQNAVQYTLTEPRLLYILTEDGTALSLALNFWE